MNPQQAKALLERELPGIIERVATAKNQFKNYSVLSVFGSQNEIYETCKLLSLYAYQMEALVIKQGIIEMGLPEIAEDFYHSAAAPNNMQSILKENADTLKSYCKVFGKNIDSAFQEISDYSNSYLMFLAKDAQGAKQFVPQMYLASRGTIISVAHPWRQ
jgi:hypothetical protein